MTAAADRDRLTGWFVENLSHEAFRDWSDQDFADALIASGVLLDADQVRHDHGERILSAIAKGVDGFRWYGVTLSQPGHYEDVITIPDLEEVLSEARDLSPAPQDPRFDDPAHAEHIATRAEYGDDAERKP